MVRGAFRSLWHNDDHAVGWEVANGEAVALGQAADMLAWIMTAAIFISRRRELRGGG
jgi:hypothetical protein